MIRLSENIKRFRLMRQMTQTQLAEVFNVSEQAVSRWENGNTYPDITLLPAIADYFGISIDELMGMETYKDEKTIDSILQTVKENERKGLITENVALLLDAAQKYPTNYTILLYLAGQLNFEYCTDEKKSKANHEKVIDIVNRIENECKDRMICNYAINEKIIALNQDALGIQAKRIATTFDGLRPDTTYITNNERVDILAKPLADGSVALGFFNLSSEDLNDPYFANTSDILEYLEDKMVSPEIFDTAKSFTVENLWTGEKYQDTSGVFESDNIKARDCMILRITPNPGR